MLGASVPAGSQLHAMHTNLACAPVATHEPPTNSFVLVIQRSTSPSGEPITRVILRKVSA